MRSWHATGFSLNGGQDTRRDDPRGSATAAAAPRRMRRAQAGSAAQTAANPGIARDRGTAPSTDASCPRGPVPGIEASSARVYGWRGLSKSRARGCDLRHAAAVEHQHAVGDLGDHAEIVGDEQDRQALSRCSLRSSVRICAWIVTSSAVVGSSAISSRAPPAPSRSSRAGACRRTFRADRRRARVPRAGSRRAGTGRALPAARRRPAFRAA